MILIRLGWAGAAVMSGDSRLLIDALGDPAEVVAGLGDAARAVPLPAVAAPGPAAAAALVTHLHRDHADAGAIGASLVSGAPAVHPRRPKSRQGEDLWVAQADAELDALGVPRRVVGAGDELSIGPFMVTALPAVDGLGDPQVSWAVRASDHVVAHFGDTMFHGYWWRIRERVGPIDVALMPINGPRLDLPHTQPPSPLSSALTPEQAVVAAGLLRARVVVPIHYEGFDVDERYTPVPDALSTFVAAAAAAGVKTRVLDAGESLDLAELA